MDLLTTDFVHSAKHANAHHSISIIIYACMSVWIMPIAFESIRINDFGLRTVVEDDRTLWCERRIQLVRTWVALFSFGIERFGFTHLCQLGGEPDYSIGVLCTVCTVCARCVYPCNVHIFLYQMWVYVEHIRYFMTHILNTITCYNVQLRWIISIRCMLRVWGIRLLRMIWWNFKTEHIAS